MKGVIRVGFSEVMKALSDPTRREILNMLKSGAMAATEIADCFDISGAAVSKHLAVLREAELVRTRREGKKGRDMNEKVIGIMNNVILIQFSIMWTLFMWKAVNAGDVGGDPGDLTGKIILMLLTVSFVPMGNIMPKAQRNSIFGLRTKWSMANDHCWQQSQRISGYIMVASGIAGTILMAVLPVEWGGYALLALILVMALGCTWASYRVYMKSQIQ